MSPCYIRLLTPDGLHPVEYEASSLADAARYEPDDGVYTVSNTYNTFQVLKLDAHLDRMENSARLAGMSLVVDRSHMRRALRQMIADAGYGDVRFRVTALRDQSDNYILSLEPFKPMSPDMLDRGVRCVSVPHAARHNPAAKTTDWMHARKRISDTLPQGIYEALLLDDAGYILEGLTSNFYAVLDSTLRTAGEGVLPGIAQQVVYDIAPAIITVTRSPAHIDDLPRVDEAFITSSSRGIVPVVAVDEHIIGEGRPGPKTAALHQSYEAWVAAHLEDL